MICGSFDLGLRRQSFHHDWSGANVTQHWPTSISYKKEFDSQLSTRPLTNVIQEHYQEAAALPDAPRCTIIAENNTSFSVKFSARVFFINVK